MTCIVQKYGGSSVADVDRLQTIARLIGDIKNQNLDIAVVVSAMGKTTDELVGLAREISTKPPRREMDMLLSTGERITMSLLSMALHERGLNAVSLTGSQAGIITNDRHNDAQVIEVRPFRVQDEMAEGKVVIIGGFLVVKWRWLVFLHLPAAVWGALIEFQGWLCPLTPLEQRFRQAAGEEGYSGGFIEHYVLPVIYPQALPADIQVTLGVFVVLINLIAYARVLAHSRE